jgi:uncharacterized protein DUF4230
MDLRNRRGYSLGRIAVGVIGLVALLAILKVANLLPGWPHTQTHTSIEPSRLHAQLVSEQKLEINDLRLSNLEINQSRAPKGPLSTIWHTDTVLHAYGDVVVSVDWKKAKVSNLARNGSVTVTLPYPVSQAHVDHQLTYADTPHCGINIILGCRPDIDLMYRAAEVAMLDESTNAKYDLMAKSRAQAEALVKGIVKAGGGDPSRLRFVWVPNPS